MKLPRTARAGFTLVEMAISVLLVGMVGGVFVLTTETTTSAVSTGVAVADLDARSVRALERVCEALKSTSVELAAPQAASPFSGEFVDFQRGAGVDADGNALWGTVERFVLEYAEADDGVDNDGDGLVDDGSLVWIEDPGGAGEQRVVVCNAVREYLEGETFDGTDENGNGLIDERGFALDFDGDCVTVRLTLAGRDDRGSVVLSTVERTISFRNRGE